MFTQGLINFAYNIHIIYILYILYILMINNTHPILCHISQYYVITQSFGSMRLSSDDFRLFVWFSWNRFLCMHYPKISFFFFKFKDGAHLRMESFFLRQSLQTFSPGANGFNFLTISHLMWKSISQGQKVKQHLQ